ncbi:hypothetical protein EVG20_g10856, partial [Dentipellis fragilis]
SRRTSHPSPRRPTRSTPVFSPPPPAPAPVEEVCVECAMRDQDMADVDVTGPGVWERDSDVYYLDLLRQEKEEEATGAPPARPRSPAALANPKEPTSKRAALENYVRSQRSLAKADTLAHMRAMQESQQIDDRMRDTYSQLRRSAYELGSAVTATDGSDGVRIKAPRLSTVASSHPREVTLLENGMIVEHVDMKREERDERERRRKEQKQERARQRKSSRGSVYDVASVYSAGSPLPHTDSGFHLGVTSNNRYSQSRSPRPSSTLTAPIEYPSPGRPQAYSASMSDMQSTLSSPNRRTRFFGRTFGSGWRSQESFAPSFAPSGFSGSMVDMHVALQRENAHGHPVNSSLDMSGSAPSISGWRNSHVISPQRPIPEKVEEKPKKKRKGLAKIWRIVTGAASRSDPHLAAQSRSIDRGPDDDHDYPLAPPPPLSYLVSRSSGEQGGGSALRHVSTPSLPSSVSPNNAFSSVGVSPPTAPSSLIPSPTSSRRVGNDGADGRKSGIPTDHDGEHFPPVDEEPSQSHNTRNVHPVTSEPDMRRQSQNVQSPPEPSPPTRMVATFNGRPQSSQAWREKSLPALPTENGNGNGIRFPGQQMQMESRPRTLFTYDPSQLGAGGDMMQDHGLVAPQAPFRQSANRRQSFGGVSSRSNVLTSMLSGGRPRTSQAMEQSHSPQYQQQQYAEFGAVSMRPLDGSRHNQLVPPAPTPTKRRSKFGLHSLLGKKSHSREHEVPVNTNMNMGMNMNMNMHMGGEASVARSSGSEARHEAMMNVNEMGSSGSGHASFRRTSQASRRNLDQLVEQSSDFVAYRYPSNDQNLNLAP